MCVKKCRKHLSLVLQTMVISSILAVAVASAVPAICVAADVGFANQSPEAYNTYANPGTSSWRALMSNMDGKAVTYQRFLIWYDTYGTGNWSQTGCVTPTTRAPEATSFLNAIQYAEGSKTVVLAVSADRYQHVAQWSTEGPGPNDTSTSGYQWQNADTPEWPTDYDLICGIYEMTAYLESHGVNISKIVFEAMNEPDYASDLANQCDPSQLPDTPESESPYPASDCAARYFADMAQAYADATGTSPAGHVIAGTFASVPASLSLDKSNCQGNADFQEQYICFLKDGDGEANIPGAAPLQDYDTFATSWSFHDYDDPSNSHNCAPSDTSACMQTRPANFSRLLSDWSEPNNDVWMTESGYYCGSSDNGTCPYSTTWQAGGAYDFEQIAATRYVQHAFWYQFQAQPDDWDSALLDSDGATRESYCVLVDGYANRGNCTG